MDRDLTFCAELKKLKKGSTIVGRSGEEFNDPPAASTENNLITLRNLLLDSKAESTLEIGMAFGASTLVFASTHRDLGRRPCRQHVAIDPYQDTVWDDAGVLLCEQAELSEYVELQNGFSSEVLPNLVQSGKEIDAVYVDGSHLFEDVFIDFYYSCRLLKEGGYILFDDSTDEHVKKVLDFIRSNMKNHLQEIDLSPYRGGESWMYRAAKLLGRVQLTGFQKIGPCKREWNADFSSF